MPDLFLVLMFLAMIGLVVGLIKPQWMRMPSRLHVLATFSTATIVCFVVVIFTIPKTTQPDTVAETASTTAQVQEKVESPVQPAHNATQAQNSPKQAQPPLSSLDPAEKRQAFARALADELVVRNNLYILRAWESVYKISTPDFASAATIREEIRRKSKDFADYKDEQNMNILTAAILEADIEGHGGADVLNAVISRFENQ